MTLIGAAIMDTERIIPPTNGSPGSGGSGGFSNTPVHHSTNSLARKKKTERMVPTPNYNGSAMVHGSYVGMRSPAGGNPSSGNSPQYANQGVTNLAYSRDSHNNSFISHPSQQHYQHPPGGAPHMGGVMGNTPVSKLNMTTDTTASVPEDSDDHQEVIEVQILPQDENWGEATTAVTHASEMDYSGDKDLEKWQLSSESSMSFQVRRHAGTAAVILLTSLSVLSPILMTLLPKLGLFKLKEHQLLCRIECDGLLVSMSFKLLALILGTWGVFYRRSRSTLPRIRVYRALVSILILLFIISFWLFYSVHLLEEDKDESIRYGSLVRFAMNLVDSLLFVHYSAVILMEIRHRQPAYFIKIVRSPDGESHCYPIGELSVQRAAAWVLEKYYTDFTIYNPFLDRLITSGGGGGSSRYGKKGVKIYDVDGAGNNTDCNSTVVSVASKKGYSASHNERFHEEYEHEKKLRKRKTRLITATEEAFTHIKRIKDNQRNPDKTPMESVEAAQAIFPSISRPLQKYLRVTRQQPMHTMQSILDHLSTCLSYDMSPRSFLERYLVTNPVLQNQYESKDVQSWALISDRLLYRDISAGTTFQLRQGDISLLCQVQNLPHFYITEEIIDSSSNRFVLRLNSETSV
ncbi:vang-like protein 2 [Lepeophtheirus salmonis]|uniref:vang-like protein 2 n=1 Tax=Lepeophtheirus salmonis TaxID=72036 RepID=UPI001AEAFF90|nr:vang-like protein 2 [Lepeophtheirus salmonis]